MKKIFAALFSLMIIPSSSFSGTIQNNQEFYQVGKNYLFIPRINQVEKGRVVLVTSQEIVFSKRFVLIHSIFPKTSRHRSAISEFLHSKNRNKLLKKKTLTFQQATVEAT